MTARVLARSDVACCFRGYHGYTGVCKSMVWTQMVQLKKIIASSRVLSQILLARCLCRTYP